MEALRQWGIPDLACEFIDEHLAPSVWPASIRELVGDELELGDADGEGRITVLPEDWSKLLGCWVRAQRGEAQGCGVMLRDSAGLFIRSTGTGVPNHFLLEATDTVTLHPCENLGPGHCAEWRRFYGVLWPAKSADEERHMLLDLGEVRSPDE